VKLIDVLLLLLAMMVGIVAGYVLLAAWGRLGR